MSPNTVAWERELLSARAPTSQHHTTHTLFDLALSLLRVRSRFRCMRVRRTYGRNTSQLKLPCAYKHWWYGRVCLCVWVLVFTLPLNRAWTALSHIDMHTPSRERAKYSALMFSNVPLPWEFLCIWFYCCCICFSLQNFALLTLM